MEVEIIGVLKPFLAFASSFKPHVFHNMIILMFDLQFKNLYFIWDYMGLIELTVHVVVKYDHKIFMPLLLAI
jgi:hypothetical protein